MEIDKLREQIDEIDDELSDLYLKRLQLCGQVGLEKAKSGKPVNAPEREKAIINRLAAKAPDDLKLLLKQLYGTVFYTSKAYQNGIVNPTSQTAEEIKKALNAGGTLPVSATVACQGVAGAYSGIAAEKMFALSDITYFKNFDGVFNAIDKGLCNFGVLPIENSNAGSVSQVYDLMRKYRFYIVKSVKVQIKHVLAAKPGAKREDIKRVVSHEQALMQCEKNLAALGVDTQAVANTAVAAGIVADGSDMTVAAVCSPESAALYGLNVLGSNLQDNAYNYTRFICISKDLRIYKGADKISVMIHAAHTPGSLSRVLDRFAALDINVTKLESRPIANSDFEFMFYFDFDGDLADPRALALIADLQNGTDDFVFLGSYKESV